MKRRDRDRNTRGPVGRWIRDSVLRTWPQPRAILYGIAIGAAAVAARLALDPWLGEHAPGLISFPAVGFAALLFGGAAGLAALGTAQLLIWFSVLPPRLSFALREPEFDRMLLITTVIGLSVVWGMTGYRKAIRKAIEAEGARRSLLELTLRELDHRSRNDFQIAIALLRSQSRAATTREHAACLDSAAAKLVALAAAHDRMSVLTRADDDICLADYCDKLIAGLRQAVGAPVLQVECDLPSVRVTREQAIALGLVLSELLYAAIQNGLTRPPGSIMILGTIVNGTLAVHVNGPDYTAPFRPGPDASTATMDRLGNSPLVTAIVEQLHGSVSVQCCNPLLIEFRIPLSPVTRSR